MALGPRVATKPSGFAVGFCGARSPSCHVFHTSRQAMIKTYSKDDIRITSKKNSNLCITGCFWGESTSNSWIPLTKGQQCGKCSNVIMSSWGPWEVWMKFYIYNFQTDFSDWWLRHLLWNCPNMNATGLHWLSVNICSGNGLVLSGNKPLPEAMLTQISDAIWCH